MKIIITENQYSLMRRASQVEHSIRPIMDSVYEYLQFGNPTPLNMSEYDYFILIITNKIANQILNNESIFDPDKKEELKKQIQRFIETEYIDMIREYFYSRMVKNINESDHEIKFKRRYQEIEDGVYDFILRHKITTMDTFDSFLIELSWDVANDVIKKINIPKDDYVKYRNQLIHFIKNNFYEELKEFWDRNTHRGRNINEDYDKRIFQRRYQYISDFIDRDLSRYDVCIYTDVIDFVDRVMDYTADNLYESLFNLEWDDDTNDVYQGIYDFISEHFGDRIRQFYDDNSSLCEDEEGNWINESDGERSIQRRYMMISDYLDKNMKPDDVCKYNDSIDFVDVIMDNIFNMLIEHIMFDEEHESLYQYIYDFMSENFGDRIRQFYDDNSFLCKDEEGNWINESTDTKDYQLMIRRRMSEITEIVETVLEDSDPCEYSRFNQYKRFIYNNVIHSVFYYSTVLQAQKIEIKIEKFKDDLLKVMSLFDDMIRKYYDTYGKHNCPDDSEIVNESISKDHISFTRRYEIIKDLVERGIDVLAQEVDICDYVKAAFLSEVCWQVSDKMEELNMNTESVDTIEKIQKWVKIYFGEYINEEFDKLMDLNCYGSFDDAEEDGE